MNKTANLSPASSIGTTETNPYPVSQSSRNLTIAAWVVTLLISTLPDIVSFITVALLR